MAASRFAMIPRSNICAREYEERVLDSIPVDNIVSTAANLTPWHKLNLVSEIHISPLSIVL